MVFIPYGEGIEKLQFYFLFFADNDSRRLPMEVSEAIRTATSEAQRRLVSFLSKSMIRILRLITVVLRPMSGRLHTVLAKTGSSFCHLQHLGVRIQMCFAIYSVWERKLELVWLFTKCGSEN